MEVTNYLLTGMILQVSGTLLETNSFIPENIRHLKKEFSSPLMFKDHTLVPGIPRANYLQLIRYPSVGISGESEIKVLDMII